MLKERRVGKKHRHPWIIAHRGARDEAPENTYTALEQAMQYAIDGIEFDVQMSVDGLALLYHDRTLLKVGGGRKRISEMTSIDLAKLDWGRWFQTRFTGEPLTPLEHVLTLLRRCPNMCIEIKSQPVDQACGHVNRLTEKVLGLINRPENRPYRGHILLLSFDADVLTNAHDMAPDLRYVLNLPKTDIFNKVTMTRHLWAVGVKISNLSESVAQWARRKNLRLFTYTCNGPRQVKKAVDMGADAIITDRPAWLVRHLERT